MNEKSIKSMTGFGRGSQITGDVEVVTEIRAVNHRFLDMFIRLPKTYSCFEPQIRKIVSDKINRGKFEITVTRSGAKGPLTELSLDHELADRYHKCLMELKDRYGLAGEITVADMLTLKEIVSSSDNIEGLEQEWNLVENSVTHALVALDEMRKTEGFALWKDIETHLISISETIDLITPLVDQISSEARVRLEKKVREMTGGLEIDDDRMLQELALIAERSDVSEELTRLKSHVEQFLAFGKEGSPLGRKLDFLLQELHREVNTLGSKSASTDISAQVVHIKTEVEKIREQTQNIE
ncbi:MAG: YicC family protein [Deltaproteobacteria bacterium]|nr:YicC family protein [Deltaproteobacteria bacterium]